MNPGSEAKMIERYNYRGDPNIGFYATVTPNHSLVPPEFQREDFFGPGTVETFIAQTRLVGLFTAGNSNCLLVPGNVTRREREKLEDSALDFVVLDSRENALGNLILANDRGAVISRKLQDSRDAIEEALDVEAEIGEVAGLPGPGVCAATNNSGVLLHREATEEEAEEIAGALEVDNVDIGTVNLGSPYIGSGLLATDENALVGEDTSGPEIGRIDRTLFK